MRQQGMSVPEIAKSLGVAKSSVSLWVRDVELSADQKITLFDRRRKFGERNDGAKANRDRALEIRKAYQEAGRAKAREGRPLHLAGCMLYWAEGAKGRNGIYFVNSDPNMLTLFMRFLKEELGVSETEAALRIHCHTTESAEIKRIEEYWANLLNVPLLNIKKTYIKEGSQSRHNVLENGVCDIRIHRTDLVQHIYGAIQEYGGFENPDWLF